MSSSIDKKDPLQIHRKPSLRQEFAVVNFIQKHPLLVQTKQLKILNRGKVYKLWIEVAKEVNSIEGVEKSPTGWLKYWIDKRRKSY
ncbi:uncharacterized protein LOC121730498 [Aricia agestis]|uniref:uncharacterized protein LOC121730498 n=1 Tax=Aricia agestis TaxID=91739 RepID=UPI001C20B26E|nr:uncharacterized protein LOC121730498 [Aricia agestis]